MSKISEKLGTGGLFLMLRWSLATLREFLIQNWEWGPAGKALSEVGERQSSPSGIQLLLWLEPWCAVKNDQNYVSVDQASQFAQGCPILALKVCIPGNSSSSGQTGMLGHSYSSYCDIWHLVDFQYIICWVNEKNACDNTTALRFLNFIKWR